MTAHVFNLAAIDRGVAYGSLECCHAPDDHKWVDPAAPDYGCWLKSWWAELGTVMLALDGLRIEIPVRPDDDWDDDGGTLVVGYGGESPAGQPCQCGGTAASDGECSTCWAHRPPTTDPKGN